MREISIGVNETSRRISVDGRELLASWTKEAQEDMARFHGINIGDVIIDALAQEVAFEMALNNEEELTEAEDTDLREKLSQAMQ